ncbi:uncharacterized protein LOC121368373 [Gigantopelta aegis]|uniref:uncharacterized protein LOC121368373 n=1 Tax=Gigantopelta aegis TaxID=1735272 RepID=UPI001B8886F3|nr:uncharacterized protein LOC121368373 [Gigantopelta aegis]
MASEYKTCPEIHSFGNDSPQWFLGMESDKKPLCICAAQSDDFKTPLCGWCMEAGDVTRQKAKHSKKSKSCSNVFKDSTFEYHAESSKYIDEYRRKYTVGNVCNYNVFDLPKLGVDLIDPYAEKIKNIRSWKRNKPPEADDKRTERGMGDMGSNRSLPILAQVLKSLSPKEKSYPETKERHPPKDRQLNLQLYRSTMKETVTSPDPVSESKLENESICKVISTCDTISVRASRSEGGAVDMMSSSSLPKLVPVRKSKYPKEKTSSDSKELHPSKDRQLNLQICRSAIKVTVIHTDPVSESKMENELTCKVISTNDTISVRASRSEGGAVNMMSSSSLPKLIPVRNSKCLKEKAFHDSKEPDPPEDRELNLQVSRSKTQQQTKCKVSSPDLVPETNLAIRSSCEQPPSMCSSKRLFKRSYRISDLDNVISKDNVISVRASLSKSMETENTSTSGVHKLISADKKMTEKHPNDIGKQAGQVTNTKCYRLKYSKKITNPENRSCVNLTPLTLRDIGGISESDAENVNREKSTFYNLKQQSQKSKSLIDCITPVARKVISHK